MNKAACAINDRKMISIFERYLTIWVGLCIVGGILLGKIAQILQKPLMGWQSVLMAHLWFQFL